VGEADSHPYESMKELRHLLIAREPAGSHIFGTSAKRGPVLVGHLIGPEVSHFDVERRAQQLLLRLAGPSFRAGHEFLEFPGHVSSISSRRALTGPAGRDRSESRKCGQRKGRPNSRSAMRSDRQCARNHCHPSAWSGHGGYRVGPAGRRSFRFGSRRDGNDFSPRRHRCDPGDRE
jgi:hypothetical protein